MAELRKEHRFRGTLEKVFHGLTKYQLYPQYLPGVTKVEVLPAHNPEYACLVRYELNLVKRFYYVLRMHHAPLKSIWWELQDSNMMKANNGSWNLEASGNEETLAKYQLDLAFKGLVPSTITNKVAASSLPAMFEGFQRLIDENP